MEDGAKGPISIFYICVVYLSKELVKACFIYISFIPHVLAALILSRLAVTRVTGRPDHSGSRSVV